MTPGETIAERFLIERRAGSGGTGTVYRAKDTLTGNIVAVKVLHEGRFQRAERFVAEARVLSELRHPSIVRYVTHGTTIDRDPYLAMEWLEGEDLGARLSRARPSLLESIELVRIVAEALEEAHARGVIHRDVKPSNIFLVDKDIAKVKLLDFGVARIASLSGTTRAGALIGTPGYMAPEQARGAKDLDARADVFSLGCVLFECLTGRAPFVAEHVMAVLAKILLEDAPRVREVRSEVPAGLDSLVARMLDKDPKNRPADAAAVGKELLSLGSADGTETKRQSVLPPALMGGEQRLLSVVLAGAALARASLATVSESEGLLTTRLQTIADAHGGDLEPLLDGSVVVTFRGKGAATDLAARTARFSLALRSAAPGSPIALAMGRGELQGRFPTGDVIDRAARLLRAVTLESQGVEILRPIRIDDVVAGLLDARFEVAGDSLGLGLKGESERTSFSRTLLGRACPCVGRERELGSLRAILDESASEPVSRVGLVTAPPGAGKSRLVQEVLLRVKSDGAEPQIWMAQGDAMSGGAPFLLVAQMVRGTAGILEGEPVGVRQRKLRARIARNVPSADADRVTEFLGEVIGAQFPDKESVQLRSARADAMLMGDQIKRAWEDFVRAESAEPLLLVVEDLQWGDLPSVKLVDATLEWLFDRPITVFALARPEVEEVFPRLWSGRGVTEIRLGPLTKKSCERLVTEVLGARLAPEAMSRIIERAAGNAFYLEELIRAASEEVETLPETVLAMVHSRLERLDDEWRRVLRAASVFGQVFWTGAVAALLGLAPQTAGLSGILATLVDRELLVRHPTSQFGGAYEYAFRHSLVREGAYATLTDEDRVLGHRLAAEWLERAGASDAMVLAEHFERGRVPDRAVIWYMRASLSALEGHDLVGVLARVDKAVACGAVGTALASLRVAAALAHRWRGQFKDAEKAGTEAMACSDPYGGLWLAALSEVVVASSKIGDVDRTVAVARTLLARPSGVATDSDVAFVIAATRAATNLYLSGHLEDAEELIAKIEPLAEALAKDNPIVLAWAHVARATKAEFAGDPAQYLGSVAAAAEAFTEAGDLRGACTQRINVGYASIEVGAYEEAEVALRAAALSAERMGLYNLVAVAKHNLGRAIAHRGDSRLAAQIETEAITAFEAQGDVRMEGASRMYLARIHASEKSFAAAQREADVALSQLEKSPPLRVYAMATLAHIRLAQGAVGEALQMSTAAMADLDILGGIEEGESLVRLVHAKALYASGDFAGAAIALRASRDRLVARAERIADKRQRASFLHAIPENQETLALFEAWGEKLLSS
jgi:eukaryotic-like serine/threonine-protein kinase